MKNATLKEVMITQVITVQTDEALSRVEEKFRTNRIRHIPVVDADRKVIGIITHRDLLRYAPPHHTEEGDVYDKEELNRFILKRIMTPDPVCLRPEDSIMQAIELMVVNKYGCIPITDADQKLAGIVTQIDILKFAYRWLKAS